MRGSNSVKNNNFSLLQNVQTAPDAQPAFYSVSLGSYIPGIKAVRA